MCVSLVKREHVRVCMCEYVCEYVCVCMYVCMYVCNVMYVCMYVCKYMCIYIYTHIYHHIYIGCIHRQDKCFSSWVFQHPFPETPTTEVPTWKTSTCAPPITFATFKRMLVQNG